MTSSPWLSVILPICNGEAYLAQALDSILNQTSGYSFLECLAVDDGSKDGTLSILEKYRAKLPLTIIHSEKKNWTASVNLALKQARGEYVSILHQDDLWLKDRLERIGQAVQEYPGAVLFLHPSFFINPEGKRLGTWHCPLKTCMNPVSSGEMVERLLVQNFISIPAPFFKREAALQIGMNETLKYTADWDFWLGIAARGETVYLKETLSCFRIHPQAQTVKYSTDLPYFRSQLETVFQKHFELWPAEESRKKKVRAAGTFSIQTNLALAAYIHGGGISWSKLALEFLKLGPREGSRYLRDSRIFERVVARFEMRPHKKR